MSKRGKPGGAHVAMEATDDTLFPRRGLGDDVMRPLADLSAEALSAVDFVLTDIDDTLTTAGRLPAIAYDGLERLQRAGIVVVPVTGRPAGWCDLIARLWPVDAVVGENGAFYFRCIRGSGMERVFRMTAPERAIARERLKGLEAHILEAVPGARVAADQGYRESDLAIDFAEDGPVLPDAEINRIVDCFESAGATAKVSSIHVNGWFGDYDKLAMTRRLFSEIFGVSVDEENERFLFVGDSPNDEPMFGLFHNSVAVANFAAFADRVHFKPAWITEKAGGEGFAQLADALLEARAR